MSRSNPRVLRLVAYNIFGFRKGSPSQLAAYLKSLMPIDVLCLNEVSIKDRRLDQLTRHLGEEYKSFFFSTTANKNPEFGNAVITRLPVKSACRIPLEGGSKVLWRGEAVQIIRNGVLVDFDDFSVCCTHLDHMRESERVKQVDGLIEQLRERLCPETPHFIMGDFNELSSEDYTTGEWSNLKQRHENFGWPFESDEVTERLLRADYVDVLRSCGDLRKTAHTQEDTPLYRIDYAWASAAAIGRALKEKKRIFVRCKKPGST
ncbi:hypothetical protein FOZ61_008406 [Perkinsus olseni]|uniref:Endonuclease/exonuclease/phosphatase domain-containing protein n=1 Tax=Perkinsus olseni TaxID=32597 RepID=A0A7J6L4U6_PEROL|nr:hypothetical protein FOZ61_008406 [Perkinsus olseni]